MLRKIRVWFSNPSYKDDDIEMGRLILAEIMNIITRTRTKNEKMVEYVFCGLKKAHNLYKYDNDALKQLVGEKLNKSSIISACEKN